MAGQSGETTRLRSVFISDVHLGFRGCRAEALCDFLRSVRTDNLILVGDIFDLWSLKKSFFWPQSHSEVVRTILSRTRDGTRVVYIPGNHDELFRSLDGSVFGNLEVHRDYIHTTAAGKRLLVMHGDEFDSVVQCHPALVSLGTALYDFLLWVNPLFNTVRRLFGLPGYSLAAALKAATPRAVQYMRKFEEAAAAAAQRRGADGIVCGHIHHAALRELRGVIYCNDGDWVESCTSLVEDMNGSLSILRWQEIASRPAAEPVLGRRARAA
ncbi:MAG: UDP-2,3-diacylglucosamine diphosphatase [Pseudomonadota bacterium]